MARARGLGTREVDLPEDGRYLDLLAGVPSADLPDVLARVLTDRAVGQDVRHERALAADIIGRLLTSIDARVTFGRLAAGAQVLGQATPPAGVLSAEEATRLAEHVGEFGRDEWTGKQLHLMGHSAGGTRRPLSRQIRPGAVERSRVHRDRYHWR